MPKATIAELDAGQLDLMWQCLQLKPKNSCTKADVRDLKYYLDFIRQAMVQKTAGQRKDDSRESVLFDDLGTYVNCAICAALALYVYGGVGRVGRGFGGVK